MYSKFKKQKGFSLIEVVIASGIISLSIMYIAKSYSDFVSLSSDNTARVQAAFLLDDLEDTVALTSSEGCTMQSLQPL